MAFTSAAYSQVLYGSLTGNVKDASGGAVPGAEVSAQERGTGLTRKTTTNESGVYVIPTLPGGVYAVTITKQGFAADCTSVSHTRGRSRSVFAVATTATASPRFKSPSTPA